MAEEKQSTKDFFISYNSADEEWAEWIAWQLEEAHFSTILQAWDFRPGANFVLKMQEASKDAQRTIAVISPSYLNANFTQPEWAAAFKQDPQGTKGLLVPVMVQDCKRELTGLWSQIIYVNIVGLNEQKACKALLEGIERGRNKPKTPPLFPGMMQHNEEPHFPGKAINETQRPDVMISTDSSKTDLPKLKLDKPFNPYKTRDEWIEYITSNIQEAIEGEASLDFYTGNLEGHRQIRISHNQDLIYSLNIYKGVPGRGDDGISFSDGTVRMSHNNDITASGHFKWDAGRNVVVLELQDLSLLSHLQGIKKYTKEEFLQALWDKIRSTLENSHNWHNSNIQPIISIDTKQEHRFLTLLQHENAQNLKILDDFWSKVNYSHKDYPHHDAIQKYHRLAYNYLAPWTHLMWEKQASLLPLMDEQVISLMYDLNYNLDQFVMLRNKMQDVFNTEENKQFWNNLIKWITAYFDGDINQRDEAQHGAWGRELDRKAIQFSNSLIPHWNEINTLYQSIHNLGNPFP